MRREIDLFVCAWTTLVAAWRSRNPCTGVPGTVFMNLHFCLCICSNSCCCSVANLCLTLQPHWLQWVRLLFPPLPPRVCSDSSPLSQWCCVNISSSVVPFYCLQSFPASGSFTMNWLFTSRGQIIGFSASAAVAEYSSSWWIFRVDFL